MKVTSLRDWKSIRLYIDKVLYLYLPLKGFNGLNSYLEDDRFYIELYNKKTILLEFRERDKWEQVLKHLDKNLPK